jgi:hypothetical protein
LEARAPALARARILNALRAAHGNARAARRILGLSQGTFYRMIERLDLRSEMEKIREASGWSSHYWWHPEQLRTKNLRE